MYDSRNVYFFFWFCKRSKLLQTTSLSYPADVVHYQQYKIAENYDTNKLVDITSGAEFIYLQITNPAVRKDLIDKTKELYFKANFERNMIKKKQFKLFCFDIKVLYPFI